MIIPTRRCRAQTAVEILILSLVFTTLLVACTSVPLKPTITLAFVCSPFERDYMELAAEQFHRENPAIVIDVIASSDVLNGPPTPPFDTTSAMAQVAAVADVFTWSIEGLVTEQEGLLYNLTDLLDTESGWNAQNLSTEMLRSFSLNGEVRGIPYGADPALVVYNPAFFESAEVTPPDYGWNWQELTSIAQQLAHRQGATIVRYGFADPGLLAVETAVLSSNIHPAPRQATPPALDDPVIVAAAQRYVDLALQDQVLSLLTQGQHRRTPAHSITPLDLIQTGEAAMGLVSSAAWLTADPAAVAHLGVVPLPNRSAVRLSGLFVSQATQNAAAAWRWVTYLSERVPPATVLPARSDQLATSALLQKTPPDFAAAARYAIQHYQAPMYLSTTVQRLRQAISDALQGEDLTQALTRAQAATERPPDVTTMLTHTVTLGAAGSTPEWVGTTDWQDREVITFMTYESWLYAPLAEAFHAYQSQIGVLVQSPPLPDNSADVLSQSTEIQTFSSADCFLSGIHPQFGFVRDHTLSLQPLVDADAAFPLDDYTGLALQVAIYNGELRGLPAGLQPQILWYNPTLFAQAKLTPPQANWTWEDVWWTASALSGGEGGTRHYGLVLWPPTTVRTLIEQAAGPVWDESTSPKTPQFNTPAIYAAAEQLARLAVDGVMVNATPLEEQRIARNLIAQNRAAMWTMGARQCEFVAGRHFPDASTDCLPALLPRSRVTTSPALPQLYYISATSSHVEACWQWLRFLSDRVLPHRFLPPRLSLISSNTFGHLVGPEAQTVYMEVSRLVPSLVLHDVGDSSDPASRASLWLDEALEQIVWQGGDAEALLDLATYRAEIYTACLRRCQDPSSEECAVTCFIEADKK